MACKKQRVPSEEQSEPDEGGFNFLLTSAEDKRRPLRQLPVLPQPEVNLYNMDDIVVKVTCTLDLCIPIVTVLLLIIPYMTPAMYM